MKRKKIILIKTSLTWVIFTFVIQALLNTTAQPVLAQSTLCERPFQSVGIPLTDLGDSEYIRMDRTSTGFFGGLYPNGSNTPPPEHLRAGADLASTIRPLNNAGNYDPENGRIVFISIGMSNTSMEFSKFMSLAQDDADINPRILFLNGALSSQTSDRWVDSNAIAWQHLAESLTRYQLSPAQVQVAWIKLTQTRYGEFPAKSIALQTDLEAIVRNLKAAYPNVKIAFLSSRIYSYTYFRGLSPEPNAYETGFSVKWLIEKQINGDPTLNYDPQSGPVVAPFLAWGPYLWANGETPRSDGLVWLPEDLNSDCTHPSDSGQLKVANMLMDFLKNDSLSVPWFLAGQNSSDHSLYLPLVTRTVTPAQATQAATPTRTLTLASATPSNTYTAVAAVLTADIAPSKNPNSQPAGLFALIFEWVKKLFARK
jgi:hypothetical protein